MVAERCPQGQAEHQRGRRGRSGLPDAWAAGQHPIALRGPTQLVRPPHTTQDLLDLGGRWLAETPGEVRYLWAPAFWRLDLHRDGLWEDLDGCGLLIVDAYDGGTPPGWAAEKLLRVVESRAQCGRPTVFGLTHPILRPRSPEEAERFAILEEADRC